MILVCIETKFGAVTFKTGENLQEKHAKAFDVVAENSVGNSVVVRHAVIPSGRPNTVSINLVAC